MKKITLLLAVLAFAFTAQAQVITFTASGTLSQGGVLGSSYDSGTFTMVATFDASDVGGTSAVIDSDTDIVWDTLSFVFSDGSGSTPLDITGYDGSIRVRSSDIFLKTSGNIATSLGTLGSSTLGRFFAINVDPDDVLDGIIGNTYVPGNLFNIQLKFDPNNDAWIEGNYDEVSISAGVIPEPSALALVGFGALALFVVARRR